ncbi:DUF2631 domain-containing protein [Pseudonocardia sp. H11422]|uniref:DUF2631 domain-containing protein n=1 Tax=Pseudonocardia sp. H11422 TaxID=2835866 RepID=UPI001BDBDBA6|nr:DUF2631 domain-containing protein [Pseudonocardia sp. H11422]
MARNSRELAQRPAVDPLDEPSAEWGWHGSFPNGTRIAAVATALFLLLMLIGHEVSITEILWMAVPAVIILTAVVAGAIRKRNAWRR